jgi:hypothetical protein
MHGRSYSLPTTLITNVNPSAMKVELTASPVREERSHSYGGTSHDFHHKPYSGGRTVGVRYHQPFGDTTLAGQPTPGTPSTTVPVSYLQVADEVRWCIAGCRSHMQRMLSWRFTRNRSNTHLRAMARSRSPANFVTSRLRINQLVTFQATGNVQLIGESPTLATRLHFG